MIRINVSLAELIRIFPGDAVTERWFEQAGRSGKTPASALRLF